MYSKIFQIGYFYFLQRKLKSTKKRKMSHLENEGISNPPQKKCFCYEGCDGVRGRHSDPECPVYCITTYVCPSYKKGPARLP